MTVVKVSEQAIGVDDVPVLRLCIPRVEVLADRRHAGLARQLDGLIECVDGVRSEPLALRTLCPTFACSR